MKKAQLSMEFMIILSAVLILFILVYTIAEQRTTQTRSQKVKLQAQSIADDLASNINAAYLAGLGTQKQVHYSSVLGDALSYTLQVVPLRRRVELRWVLEGNTHLITAPIITSNVSSFSGSADFKILHTPKGVVLEN